MANFVATIGAGNTFDNGNNRRITAFLNTIVANVTLAGRIDSAINGTGSGGTIFEDDTYRIDATPTTGGGGRIQLQLNRSTDTYASVILTPAAAAEIHSLVVASTGRNANAANAGLTQAATAAVTGIRNSFTNAHHNYEVDYQ